LRLIEKVYEGEEVIIARGGQPLVRLQPLREKTGQRKPGSMKGKLKSTLNSSSLSPSRNSKPGSDFYACSWTPTRFFGGSLTIPRSRPPHADSFARVPMLSL